MKIHFTVEPVVPVILGEGVLVPTKTYKFNAKIEAGDGGGAYVLFPYDVEKEFGTKGRIAVEVTFDGIPYKGSLIKYGNPLHMLPMLKAIREQIGKGVGDKVTVELRRDDEPRTIEVPPEFKSAMEKAGVLAVFERLSYSHRREYCRWIADAKKDETRKSRLERALLMLKRGVKTPDHPNA